MLFEIHESVLREALADNENALNAINRMAFARKNNRHIVIGNRRTLVGISQIQGLDDSVKRMFHALATKLATRGATLMKLPYRVIVTFDQQTRRCDKLIYLNPNEVKNFRYEEETQLLTENINDRRFFDYMLIPFMKKNRLFRGLKCIVRSLQGGGNTSHIVYEQEINERQRLCLAILDGDKKSDDPSEKWGDTFEPILEIDRKRAPFNCHCYAMTKVREVENLIPLDCIKAISNYKNKQILALGLGFDMSYFDFKEGLSYKDIYEDKYETYWCKTLISYTCLADEVEEASAKRRRSSSVEEFTGKYGSKIIIEGFGNKILESVLKDACAQKVLHNITENDLSESQVAEWCAICELILCWGCCMRTTLVNL